MIYLQVALRDYKDQDIQYVEVPPDTPNAIPYTDLSDREAWAIKAPTRPCTHQVLAQVPGCELHVYNRVTYLMSPKAILHFPRENMQRDVLFLTCNVPGSDRDDSHFLMVHLKNRHFWHLPWCITGNLPDFMRLALGLSKPLRSKGFWRVLRMHHKVIDLKTFIYFNMYHAHLEWEEVTNVLRHCNVQGTVNNQNIQTFPVDDNEYFHAFMLVSKSAVTGLPPVINNVNVDQWHTDAVNMCFGTDKVVTRRLNVRKLQLK